jgi:hypothetical protein
MNSGMIKRRVRYAHVAAFALTWVLTGCRSETGSFNAAASEKVAAEKGLKPGGQAAKEPGKRLRRGRLTTATGDTSLPKP